MKTEGRKKSVQSPNILLLIPVFNDWQAATSLLRLINDKHTGKTEILFIDDASTTQIPDTFNIKNLENIAKVSILRLKRNLGHQRAIAIGLAYIEDKKLEYEAIVVMDGDGEDDPADIKRLYEACKNNDFKSVVFAGREKRSEGLVFKLFYFIYTKLFFGLAIGQKIGIGNFSIIPKNLLGNVTIISEIWNHYAIGLKRSKIPFTQIPTHRAKRLHGESKMNFVSLLVHGLSAISIYGDMLGARMIAIVSSLAVINILAIMLLVFIKLFTQIVVPAWTASMIVLMMIFLIQIFILILQFIFIILSNRNLLGFLPKINYHHFIDKTWDLS